MSILKQGGRGRDASLAEWPGRMSVELRSTRLAPAEWQSRGTVSNGPGQRLVWVDMLRGAALAGMVAYHGVWDLHAFGFVGTDPSLDAGWRLLGRAVAGLFLALSGFGLSLAARQGTSPEATVLRLGRIAAAAVLVSFVTRLTVPEAPVWFGILHCIVVTNALALPLRRSPCSVLLLAAAAAWAAPHVFRDVVGSGWAWTGLAASEPTTLDFRPVLPWLAPVLVGMVLGRTPLAASPLPVSFPTHALRPLAWAGRRSLLVYLAHQPILIGVLMIVLWIVPHRDLAMDALRTPEQAGAFLQQCRNVCTARGGDPALCSSTCHCVLTTAVGRTDPLPFRWPPMIGGTRRPLEAAVALCRQAAPQTER